MKARIFATSGVLDFTATPPAAIPPGSTAGGVGAWPTQPAGTLQAEGYPIARERVAYSSRGAWHMEPDVDAWRAMYHSASDRDVCGYLAEHPHLVSRLAFFHRQVTDLWGRAVAQTLRLSVQVDPGDCYPSLVVWAAAPQLSPEDGADGKLEIFLGQRQRFGAWPDGIGFSLLLVDTFDSD